MIRLLKRLSKDLTLSVDSNQAAHAVLIASVSGPRQHKIRASFTPHPKTPIIRHTQK